MAPAVMMRGKPMLQDPAALGVATETAVLKHLFARYYRASVSFSYWQDKQRREVDLVADTGRELVPFEVKYRSTHTGVGDLKGLLELCRSRSLERGYVVTRALDDPEVPSTNPFLQGGDTRGVSAAVAYTARRSTVSNPGEVFDATPLATRRSP